MAFSLLFGGFFAPLQAKAGFFSSILGNEASANTDVPDVKINDNNSQNMVLLQANASSATLIQDKKSKDSDNSVKEDANVNIVSDNALLPATGPMGVGSDEDLSSDDVSTYVIKKGDSIGAIAKMFNVSENTILWANDMKKSDKLVEGNILLILPVSGIKHTVAKGQTLKTIAKKYKTDASDIASFNGIAVDSKLAVGDELIIPDGQRAEEGDKPAVNLGATIEKDKNYYIAHPIKNLVGYFINPLPTGRKTQGLHDRGRAIDIGAPKGTPIYASASGAVSFAKIGYNGGFGNLVILKHPNGTETYYAHQSKLAVSSGQQVSQGQIIGYVGSTGRSTGPHLHFEVRGARNPGADWSWASNATALTGNVSAASAAN